MHLPLTGGKKLRLEPFAYVLSVPDLSASAAYFRDALGFALEWPPDSGWQLARRGNVRVMLGHHPEALSPPDDSDGYFAYLRVNDADAFYRELVWRRAIVLQPPADKMHKMREFLVATPDGHRMMIGQTLDQITGSRR